MNVYFVHNTDMECILPRDRGRSYLGAIKMTEMYLKKQYFVFWLMVVQFFQLIGNLILTSMSTCLSLSYPHNGWQNGCLTVRSTIVQTAERSRLRVHIKSILYSHGMIDQTVVLF